jgi:16S rRNA (guanine966-N2)-methyltransferase
VTRIISGACGGRRLEVPRGVGTRPTSDRVREALFSALEHQKVLAGSAILDLYAGSGALGLEALSRGAARATFVESDREAVAVLRRNVAALSLGAAVRVLPEPVERVLLRGAGPGPGAGDSHDLVLADPPYGLGEDDLADVLALLPAHGWLGSGGSRALVVIERSARSPEPRWPGGLRPVDERRYGETRLWWARRVDGVDAA